MQLSEIKKLASELRLAADGWDEDWKTLIATLMSARTTDKITIPIAEELFSEYKNLKDLSKARYNDILRIFRSLNYNKTKARNVIAAARYLIDNYNGKVPDKMEDLLKLPGVGRKTANLIITECHNREGICVDTHVHRLANVLGLVKTKNPHQTEIELMKVAPKKYWSRINRLFVLWGKEVFGRDKKRLLKQIYFR